MWRGHDFCTFEDEFSFLYLHITTGGNLEVKSSFHDVCGQYNVFWDPWEHFLEEFHPYFRKEISTDIQDSI